MSVFTQRTGVRSSRLVGEEREPLDSTDKMKLTLIVGGAAVALGCVVFAGLHDDGGAAEDAARANADRYPSLARERLMATYGYFGSGIAITAITALACVRNPSVVRFAANRPMVFMIGGAATSIGGMMVASALPPEQSFAKHVAYGVFTGAQGATLLPIMALGGPIVAQAATATGIMVGGVSAVAAVAPSDSFLWMGGGLTVGLGVVVASSLGRIFFPASNLLMNVSLYGGLALFGGMQLYDVQRTASAARTLPPGAPFDPMRHAISQYLNAINIFVRMAQIFAMSNNNRRR